MTVLSVEEAAATYAGAMRNVQPAGLEICATCKTFIGSDFTTCYPCGHQPSMLDAVVPITYSEHGAQMHDALRGYKDGWAAQARNYALIRLAAILWRFLDAHEACVARAGGVDTFDVVTIVPSSTVARNERPGGLRSLIQMCEPVQSRFEELLEPTDAKLADARAYDEARYRASRELEAETILLIDDTWTSGGHAQSAASVLKAAGAGAVALVVIGRHINPNWDIDGSTTSGERLAELPRRFNWDTCAVHDA